MPFVLSGVSEWIPWSVLVSCRLSFCWQIEKNVVPLAGPGLPCLLISYQASRFGLRWALNFSSTQGLRPETFEFYFSMWSRRYGKGLQRDTKSDVLYTEVRSRCSIDHYWLEFRATERHIELRFRQGPTPFFSTCPLALPLAS